jgi:hypothetical protein
MRERGQTSGRPTEFGGRSNQTNAFIRGKVVRPGRFELPTFWFVAKRSIQLSYGRNGVRKQSE